MAKAPLPQAQGGRHRPPCRATQSQAFRSAQEAVLRAAIEVLKAAWFARYRINRLLASADYLGAKSRAWRTGKLFFTGYRTPQSRQPLNTITAVQARPSPLDQ